MSENLVIIGAGYTGLRLADEAISRGFEVTGTTRSEQTIETLDGMGARGVRWDVDDDDVGPVRDSVPPGSTVVYSVPTLFRDYRDGEAGQLPRHVRPVARVMEAAAQAGAGRFIYLSSTSVYGDHDGAWVDEDTPASPTSPAGKMRRDIEEYVLERPEMLDVNVARLVGIYGPGRTMVDYMRRGLYKLVDGGTKPSNRIHVDDIVGGLLALMDRAPSGARLYNFSDGHPKTVVEVVDWLVDHLDIERPPTISMEEYAESRGENAVARWKNTYRVNNERLTGELGYTPEYPDVFAGLEAIYEQ